MTLPHIPLLLQSSGQAARASTADAAQAQAQAGADLARAQAELARAQTEARRAGIEAEIARSEAVRARFSVGSAPPIAFAGGPSRRQESMMFAGFVVLTIATVVILRPFARAFSRRFERSSESVRLDANTAAQLQRIEQAVDAMAVEIERLSEGQRFTTKLLAGRAESESLINRG